MEAEEDRGRSHESPLTGDGLFSNVSRIGFDFSDGIVYNYFGMGWRLWQERFLPPLVNRFASAFVCSLFLAIPRRE